MPKLRGRIFSVAISPDASRIAAAATLDGKSEVQVWQYDFSGELDNEIKKILAKRVADRSAQEKEKVKAYREQSAQTLSKIEIDDAAVYAIRLAPNNDLFIASNDGKIRQYAPDGNLRRTLSSLPTDSSVTANQPSLAFDAAQWTDPLPELESVSPPTEDNIANITVVPADVALDSPYAYCQLIVTAETKLGERIDISRSCRYDSPENARVNQAGLVRPIRNGQGVLKIAFGPHQVSVKVTSSHVEGDESGGVDFIRDVNPVLSRLGCNQGTCHGAQKGKNGFKLSLRGYDPIFDLRALTDDLSARRINQAAPGDSLMLRKTLGLSPHQGGTLMTDDDPYHAVLRRWIADGSHLDLSSPKVVGLELFPINPVVQTIGSKQQVRLVAKYADGSSRDVTREAFIESGNSEVATASDGGVLSAIRRGEAAILARYEGNYVATTLTVMGDRSGFVENKVETWSRIDELVADKWQRVKVQPSGLCDDATFLRRVHLDLTGMPPSSDDVRAFLADETPTRQKRERVVDELLASETLHRILDQQMGGSAAGESKVLGRGGQQEIP